MTEVIQVDPQNPESDRIARAADRLRDGGLVAFPTETVYGLGVHALDREAVRRLFEAKGRPANDPLIVHVAGADMLAPLVAHVPAAVNELASRFWPGPLTIILPRSSAVPDEVTAGLDTVAIRVPVHPVAQALLRATALPIAAPSANLFSRPSPTRAEHVLADLRDRIDVVVDGGATTIGLESTVLDMSGAVPTVLRPGAITLEMLRQVLPDAAMRERSRSADDSAAMPSPGLLSRHYAPRTPLTLYRGATAASALTTDARQLTAAGQKVIVLAHDDEADDVRNTLPTVRVVTIGLTGDPGSVASRLYAALREADALGGDAMLMRDLSGPSGLEEAVRDRLQRAADRIVGT